MSHEVEKMVFTGKKPWWYGNSAQQEAVGVDLGEGPITSEEAIKAAGLDWKVQQVRAGYLAFAEQQRIHLATPWKISNVETWEAVSGQCFLIRDSDGSILGRCTDEYQAYQNREAFTFLDSLVADGQLLYHTAGSLDGGKRVWILAQTPLSWIIKRKSGAENKHHAFINAILGHTGDIGISLLPTDVRVECANTQSWAESKAEGQNLIFRVPHRGDVNAKMELAALAIQTLSDQVEGRREVLQALAQAAMSTDEFVDFATSIFLGLDGEAEEVEANVAKFYEDVTPRSKTIMEHRVAKVTEKFIEGQGNEGDTMYDAVQAFSEYFDHFDLDHVKDKIEKGKRAAKAVQSSWLGAGAERKSLVYKRLRERLNS